MITEAEMRVQTQFGTLDIENFKAGKQAQCVVLNDYEGHGKSILKVVQDKDLSEAELFTLLEATPKYRQALEEAGVLLPQNYAISLIDGQIIMVDEFIGDGRDVKQQMSRVELTRHEAAGLINFLHNLPDGDKPFRTKVMGDFKPDNFIYSDSGGRLYFIDYFAPKLFGDDGELTPYINPQIDTFSRKGIRFLCGDRRGQISRLLALVKRDAPNYYDAMCQYALSVYQDMPVVKDYLQGQIDSGFEKIDQVYKSKDKSWEAHI